jgi:putative PIN family toxin of toxin-antitoxin system
MRAVLDPNVIVSAALSRDGAPAKVLRAWMDGSYELVVSPWLLTELRRVFGYPKIARRVTQHDAGELLDLLHRHAQSVDDPTDPPAVTSPDPDDDYLIALAEEANAVIVSGDAHLHSVADYIPVYTPAAFLTLLAAL